MAYSQKVALTPEAFRPADPLAAVLPSSLETPLDARICRLELDGYQQGTIEERGSG